MCVCAFFYFQSNIIAMPHRTKEYFMSLSIALTFFLSLHLNWSIAEPYIFAFDLIENVNNEMFLSVISFRLSAMYKVIHKVEKQTELVYRLTFTS